MCTGALGLASDAAEATYASYCKHQLLDRTPTLAQSKRIQTETRFEAECLMPFSGSSRDGCITGGAHDVPQAGPLDSSVAIPELQQMLICTGPHLCQGHVHLEAGLRS